MLFHVYILLCSNGAFYVGYTQDLNRRVKAHNAGKGAAYTQRNGPVELVYAETHGTEIGAMRREQQLKRWSRAKKQALIAGDLNQLRDLAKRRK